jgi:hypothetical protein
LSSNTKFKIAKASSVFGLLCVIFSSSIFYGIFIGMVGATYLFHLSESASWLFGFLPVAALSFGLMLFNWRKLAKAAKLERWIGD